MTHKLFNQAKAFFLAATLATSAVAQTSPAARLDQTVSAACSACIDGVSIRSKSTAGVTLQFKTGATAAQQTAAQNALITFDWSDAAQTAWEDAQAPERTTLRNAAAQAITDNNAFLALSSPTAAQVANQVKILTRQNTALIKRLILIQVTQ